MMNAVKMPFLFGRLLLWFLIIYISFFHLSDIIQADDRWAELMEYTDPKYLLLLCFTGIAWFSYSLWSYWLLYHQYNKLQRPLLGMVMLVGVLGCMVMRAFWEEVVFKSISGYGNYNPDMSWNYYLLDQILYALIFTALGIVFYLMQRADFQEDGRREAEALRRETELKFLRSQVNPHFLFNTLNNLYSLIHSGSDHALPVVEKLSGLLRYSLYEKDSLVPLEKELDYLRDLIHLEELRVDNLIAAQLETGPFTLDWCLPPLLLVPFVENAFKHGNLQDPEQPLRVTIRENEQGDLWCQIINAKRAIPGSKDALGGIGVENVRKRLALLYPGQHELTIANSPEQFRVELNIERGAARRCKGLREAAVPRTKSSVPTVA
jgi:two-component system LytT family sensor kinase